MSGVAGLAPRALLEPHRHLPGAFCIDRIDGRTCFAGSLPSSQLVVDASGTVHRMRNGVWSVLSEEPIDAISRFFEDSRVTPAFLPDGIDADEPLPRTVGYLGYELGRWIEHVPVAVADPLRLPLAVLSTYDAADVWSPARERVERIRFVASQCTPPLDTIAAALAASPATCTATDLRTDNDRYERGFRRIKQAIAAGEIYQANLSWRTTWRTPRTPSLSWQQLCRRQPVPHGFYFDCSAFQVLGNSPECFLEVRGRAVRTSPIKGTRRRGRDHDEDRALAEELLADPKESAEHVMIVDLERNDLGRVCRSGSVQVRAMRALASYSTLHHLVSDVCGELREDVDLATLLRATFPGGSITGTPKIKAMEIIAETEGVARGVYTGATGFGNGAGALELGVAIRTAVAAHGRLFYSAGGGIVADSRLEAEAAESRLKALAFEDVLFDESGRDERAETPS